MNSNSQKLDDKLKLAYWYCQRDEHGEFLTQSAVCERVYGEKENQLLNAQIRSQRFASVSRYYVEKTIRKLNLTPAETLRLKTLLFNQEAVEKKLTRYPSFKRLIVVPAAEIDPLIDDELWDSSVRVFGLNLAQTLIDLFREQCNCIGVGWGRTLANVVAGIEELSCSVERNEDSPHINFFPMWGALYRSSFVDPVISSNHQLLGASSTALSYGLHRTVCGCSKETLSIDGVPAIVPRDWLSKGRSKGKLRTRKDDFLTDLCEYTSLNSVFGHQKSRNSTSRPLVQTMDCAIVTIGSKEHSSRYYFGESFVRNNPSEQDNFEKFVIGDIGGVMLTREVDSNEQTSEDTKKLESMRCDFVNQYSECFTCTKREHLEDLSKRSVEPQSESLGVVAIVHGSVRLSAVLKALEEGLVNTLCVCNHLALKLDETLT